MMNMKAISALVVGVLALAAPPASALDFYLIAKEVDAGGLFPGSPVMWGFAEDPLGASGCWGVIDGGVNSAASKAARMASPLCTGPAASVPGPRLVAPPVATDAQVRIRLVNLLNSDDGGEPISVVIPGQAMPSRNAGQEGPTWTDGSFGPSAGTPGTRRVRSFGRETAVDGGRRAYNWPAGAPLRDGTYLYHSGTHPQLQVQMGLYGALTRDAAAGTAYGGATPILYDNEATLVYSEIDPGLHAAVVSGAYGTTGPTSTFSYHPQYYLVNGQPFDSMVDATIPGLVPGERTLLRLLNAGLQSHTPSLLNLRMTLVAEDGNPYPHVREEHSALLAPLKTKDAILTPTSSGLYPLYDGMLNLSDTVGSPSGMLSYLDVSAAVVATGSANQAPIARVDRASTASGTPVTIRVLANDSDADGTLDPASVVIAKQPRNGSVVVNGDGTVTYTPNANFTGSDNFRYRVADDAGALSRNPNEGKRTRVRIRVTP